MKHLIYLFKKVFPPRIRLYYSIIMKNDRESLLQYNLSSKANKYEKKQYGNEYGGFIVCDEKLNNHSDIIVYSFGIGEDLSFSEALMNSFSPNIYAYDPTPRSIMYVNKHSLSKNGKFHFFPFGLSDKDEKTQFFLPINETWVSGSAESGDHLKKVGIDVEMKRLNSILQKNGHNHVDLLKMDIEGSEFKVIDALRNCCASIDQICVEIHDRFFDDGYKRLQKLLHTMKDRKYQLVAIKNFEELTFVKK